jgi:hypothetical protein
LPIRTAELFQILDSNISLIECDFSLKPLCATMMTAILINEHTSAFVVQYSSRFCQKRKTVILDNGSLILSQVVRHIQQFGELRMLLR